jgi:hypothetical protein
MPSSSSSALTERKQSISDIFIQNSRRLLVLGAAMLTITVPATSQSGEVQQKLAAAKQAAAENRQRLHQYQWVETTQLTLKGDAKPPVQNGCVYGPDGTVHKTLLSPPPEPPSGGRMKQRIVAKKKGEIKDYMEDVKSLLSMYVPPDPQRMQAAYQAGKLSLNPVPGGMANLIFNDYAQPGDKMTLTFNTAAKKIAGLNIDTYLGEEKDAVTLQVQMSALPDGTNYAWQTVLNATAKKLVVTTTNTNYQKLGAN